MSATLIEMTSNLVAAQLAMAQLSPDEIISSIHTIHGVLQDLAGQEDASLAASAITGQLTTALDSIQRSKVICLECGKDFRLLSNRHLATHKLTPREYKQKHGLPLTQPLSSRTLTQRRKRLAKVMGSGAELAKYREAKRRKMGV